MREKIYINFLKSIDKSRFFVGRILPIPFILNQKPSSPLFSLHEDFRERGFEIFITGATESDFLRLVGETTYSVSVEDFFEVRFQLIMLCIV